MAQRRDAVQQRDVAVSRELAAESTKALGVDPELGVRLALWALDTAPTAEAGAALREATLGVPPARRRAGRLARRERRCLQPGRPPHRDRWHRRARASSGTRRRGARSPAWTRGHGPVHAARYAPDGGDGSCSGSRTARVVVTDASLGRAATCCSRRRARPSRASRISADGRRVAAALERRHGTRARDRRQRAAACASPAMRAPSSASTSARTATVSRAPARTAASGSGTRPAAAQARSCTAAATAASDVAFSPDGTPHPRRRRRRPRPALGYARRGSEQKQFDGAGTAAAGSRLQRATAAASRRAAGTASPGSGAWPAGRRSPCSAASARACSTWASDRRAIAS